MAEYSDLYFMLNPALGIIKIGIANDVATRRKALECTLGVPLDVLCVVPGKAQYEKPLHLALAPSRLCGEWFAPTPELLALIADPSTIPGFLAEMKPQMAAWEREKAAEATRQAAERAEATRAEREELARLNAERERIKQQRQNKLAAKAREREQQERDRVEAERLAWASRSPELRERLMRGRDADLAEERRAIIERSQRARNAAILGVREAEN
jgi:hypothetical protein